MSDNLLNIREAAVYLGVGERAIKEMVDSGQLPAYRIGGAFLRFKKSQLAITKASMANKEKKEEPRPPKQKEDISERAGTMRDFLYFNDFYILSVVVIVIAIALMVAT